MPDVVFASDAPPVDGVVDLEPEAPGDVLRVLDEPAAAGQLLHRPPAVHDVAVDGHVRDLGRLEDLLDGRLGQVEAVGRRGPDVDLEMAALRDDVRAQCRRR